MYEFEKFLMRDSEAFLNLVLIARTIWSRVSKKRRKSLARKCLIYQLRSFNY